jgi:signal transduction histidine kinase
MRASLLRDAPGPNGDRRKTAVAIETAANRMKRLIRDLLDVTRAEARRFSVEHTPVRPDTIVAQAVASQQALATAAAIDLRASVRDHLPDVNGDRDRLLQIFENLIGNAIKFTPPGGIISVGAAARNRHVMFCVKDTGFGISAEDLPHVFDRFWQGQRQKRAGAGLGLAIVRALVEAHGGRVWVHSAPERGTTFYFTIPVAEPKTRSTDSTIAGSEMLNRRVPNDS